jgi:N-acyl-D-aspartate/D-glutamate deacylase
LDEIDRAAQTRRKERQMHDWVIRGATVVDGTGRAPFVGDVAIDGGHIAAIGEDAGAGREEVDGRGLTLMPGIIDAHTHYDAQVTWDPFCDPSPAHGVTTVVTGNCGFTLAPTRPADRERMMRHLVRVEGMSIEALQEGTHWDFETFPEYLAMLERRGIGPNIAVYIGHSALRTFVLGAEASDRAANDVEIETMRGIVADAMAAGAVGFSTSTHEQHVGDGGVPMPSRLADEREMRGLMQAVGESKRGMLMLVKGSATTVPYLEGLAAAAGRPMLVSAMRHHPSKPHQVFDDLGDMRAARERGAMLYGQCSCMPMSMDFTLGNPYPFEAYEAWGPAIRAGSIEAYKAVLADPAFRAGMKQDIESDVGARIFRGDWSKMLVAEAARPENRHLEERSVADLAAEAGQHPLDTFLDLGLAEDLATTFTTEFSNYEVEAVGRILADPDNQISLGDGGAHLSFLCEAGFGLHLLGRWVRELGVLTLPEAVRRLTSQPANLFGFRDRGVLRAGAAADLLLFDPATVGIGAKHRLFDMPAGASRLRTDPIGVHGVWINGVRVADDTGMIAPGDARPGQVLRPAA